MPFEAGLIAYAGLASIAAGRKGQRGARLLPPAIAPSAARAAGVVLLMISVLAAMVRFGPAVGTVAWTGELCIAGVALVLLMSWRLWWALMLGGPALAAALLIAFF